MKKVETFLIAASDVLLLSGICLMTIPASYFFGFYLGQAIKTLYRLVVK
jgi:hypothetical protein